MGEVTDRLARILFKSLGAILALQESIAERWSAARETSQAMIEAPGPTVAALEQPSATGPAPGN